MGLVAGGLFATVRVALGRRATFVGGRLVCRLVTRSVAAFFARLLRVLIWLALRRAFLGGAGFRVVALRFASGCIVTAGVIVGTRRFVLRRGRQNEEAPKESKEGQSRESTVHDSPAAARHP